MSIQTCSIYHMWVIFPAVEFLTILYTFRKKRKSLLCVFTFFIKCHNRRFYVIVMWWTSQKCTKKHDAPAVVLLCSLNQFIFQHCHCPCCHSCLSSLIVQDSQSAYLYSGTKCRNRKRWPVLR